MQEIISNLNERIDSEVYTFLDSYVDESNVFEFYFSSMDELVEHEVEQVLEALDCPDVVEDVEYCDGNIVVTLSKYVLEELTEELLREWSQDSQSHKRDFWESRGF